MEGSAQTPKNEEIERLAYTYWEERGRPIGSPEIDWFRAVEAFVGEVDESWTQPDEMNKAIEISESKETTS